jgi:TonB family protein
MLSYKLAIALLLLFLVQYGENVCVVHVESLEYPDAARGAQIQGVVKVTVRIAQDGHVVEASAQSGHPILRHEAEANAKKWTFNTEREKTLEILYDFRLEEPRYSFRPPSRIIFDFPNRVTVLSNFRLPSH